MGLTNLTPITAGDVADTSFLIMTEEGVKSGRGSLTDTGEEIHPSEGAHPIDKMLDPEV